MTHGKEKGLQPSSKAEFKDWDGTVTASREAIQLPKHLSLVQVKRYLPPPPKKPQTTHLQAPQSRNFIWKGEMDVPLTLSLLQEKREGLAHTSKVWRSSSAPQRVTLIPRPTELVADWRAQCRYILCCFSRGLWRCLPEFLMLAPRHSIRSYLHPSCIRICIYFLFQTCLDWSGSPCKSPRRYVSHRWNKTGSYSPLVTWLAPRLGACSEYFRSNLFVLRLRNSKMHCLAAFGVRAKPIPPSTHLRRAEPYNCDMVVEPKHCLSAELG